MSYLLRLLGKGLAGDFAGYLSKFLRRRDGVTLEAAQQEAREHATRADVQLTLGLKQMERGRLVPARQAFEIAVRLGPDLEDARVALAAVLSDLGSPADAVTVLEPIAEGSDQAATVRYIIGQLHERQSAQADAAEAYRWALAADPTHVAARQRLAALELVAGNLDVAAHHYAALKRHQPDDFDTRVTLASLHIKRGDTAAAVREYQDAIIIEPDNWEARCDLADCLEREGLPEQALDEIRRVLDAHPDYPDMHLRAARLLVQAGDIELADYHLVQALTLNPRYLQALVLRGQVLMELGRMEEAVHHYDRAARLNDQYLEAYVGLAVAYRQMGREKEADAVVELACEVAPGSAQLYREMTHVATRVALSSAIGEELDVPAAAVGTVVDELDPAEVLGAELRDHADAVGEHPDYPDYRYRYGLLLKSAGRHEEALEQFRAAVAINPTYIKALVKLGLTAWELGRLDEATLALSQAVNLEPEYVDLHYRLGLVYADQGLWPLAVEQYREALTRVPGEDGVEASLALALENMGLVDGDGPRFAETPVRQTRASSSATDTTVG